MINNDVISAFIDQYAREFDYYQEVARLCHQKCEDMLEQNGIRAIATYRAKRPDRLRKKLEERNKAKKYREIKDIYADVVDLAGVRIALYFPGDRKEVDQLINSQFKVNQPKTFPETSKRAISKSGYAKKFAGYHANHYRVQLKAEYLSDSQVRYAQANAEIQVASVVMHAWAEVEHDLIYKPLQGTPSEDEHAVLDELNGIVLASEIALERLQRAMKLRTQDQPFSNHYELAAYLHQQATYASSDDEPIMGRADILFTFLKTLDMNRAQSIKPFAEKLLHDQPIVQQVIDRIVAGNEEKYLLYQLAL